jgi:hypothetical protein
VRQFNGLEKKRGQFKGSYLSADSSLAKPCPSLAKQSLCAVVRRCNKFPIKAALPSSSFSQLAIGKFPTSDKSVVAPN